MTKSEVYTMAKDLRLKHALPLSNARKAGIYQGKPLSKYNGFSDKTLALGLLYADAAAHHIAVVETLTIKDKKQMHALRGEIRSGIQRYCQELAAMFFPANTYMLHYEVKPQAVEGLPSKPALGVTASNAILNLLPNFTRSKGSLNNLLLAPLLDILLTALRSSKQYAKITPDYVNQNINQQQIDVWLKKIDVSGVLGFRKGQSAVEPDKVPEDIHTLALRASVDVSASLKTMSKEMPGSDEVKIIFSRGEILNFNKMLYIAKRNGEVRPGQSIEMNTFRQLEKA